MQVNDSELIAKINTVKTYPTAIWLDHIAAIYGGEGNGGRKGLEETLDHILTQKQGNAPISATFVIYDLPGRDCHALASNGQLPLTQAGLQTYGPGVLALTWFEDSNFPNNMTAIWDEYWGYIHKQNIAPLFIGEFGADTYLEVSFSSGAGLIAAGRQSADIQIRVSKADWSNFDESNDYSFDATKSSYTDWNKVTLFHNGSLVWGIEP